MKAAPACIAVAVFALAGILLLHRPANAFATLQTTQAPESTSSETLQQQIVAAERRGLDALKAGDLQQFADLTADEAVLVDAQGAATKAQVMKNVAGFTLADYTIEDVKFVPVSANTGLISYKITEKGASHGREFTAQAYISSLWTQRNGKWLCLFSQESAVPKRAVPAG